MADIKRYRRFGINSQAYEDEVECLAAAILNNPIAFAQVIVDLINRIETLENDVCLIEEVI